MKKLPVVSAKLTFLDWPTPDGIATVVYIAGCEHKCKNCQSPDLADQKQFQHISIENVAETLIYYAKQNRTFNVVFSGGDPLYHNAELKDLMSLLKTSDNRFKFCIYTGFEFNVAKNLIDGYEFIKTGPYVEELKQESGKTDEKFILASTNQEIHDSNGKNLTKNGILRFH